jgi:hypothetical protein
MNSDDASQSPRHNPREEFLMQVIMNVRRVVLFVVLGLLDMRAPAVAQTCQWSSVSGGTSSSVFAFATFDDGTGPALYVGGLFTMAGNVPANYIARWGGSQWSALGSGTNGPSVTSLTVFDDGNGPALYAGGIFTTAGGVPANGIAKWNGSQWSPVGDGVTAGSIIKLTVFDDGNGPALYAGGEFSTAGGVPASNIAKWDGTQWSPLGEGVGGDVYEPGVIALTVFDDGNGPALYAGGEFATAGGVPANNIAKWDGAQWSALGSGMSYDVEALTTFDDGSGPALYAGGAFATAGDAPANNIAKWSGAQWSPVGSGLGTPGYQVTSLTVFDDGMGRALYAGGYFRNAGELPVNNIAKWDGLQWSPLGGGLNSIVWPLTPFDDGTGPALYTGGAFTTAGGVPANRIAKWSCQ